MTRASDRTLLQALGFNDPDKGNEEHDLGCRYLIQPAQMEKLVEMLFPRDKLKSTWRDYTDRYGPPYGNSPDARDQKFEFSNHRIVGVEHEGRLETVVQRPGYNGSAGYHIGFLDSLILPAWISSATRTTWRRSTQAEIEREIGPRPTDPMRSNYIAPKDTSKPFCISCGRAVGSLELSERGAHWHRACLDKTNAYYEADRLWQQQSSDLQGKWVAPTEDVVTKKIFHTCSIGIEVKIGQIPIGNAIRQIKLYASYCDEGMPWVLATRYAISKGDRDALKNENILHIRLAAGFDAYLESQRNAPEAESPEL